jgi:hypothetical protein
VTSTYVPENATLVTESRLSSNERLRLYKINEGFVVVHTRQIVDPGNSVCYVPDRATADYCFERNSRGYGCDRCSEWNFR